MFYVRINRPNKLANLSYWQYLSGTLSTSWTVSEIFSEFKFPLSLGKVSIYVTANIYLICTQVLMKQLLNFHRLQPGVSRKTQLPISPLIRLGTHYHCTACALWTAVPSQAVPFMITGVLGDPERNMAGSYPGYHKTSYLLFEWIHERIFHLYANRAFAQGCFAASHCDRVNHVLTTQPSSSMSSSLSISNFGNKWLKRIYWLLRVGFTSPTFSRAEVRCQVWPGHLGFCRRIQHKGA